MINPIAVALIIFSTVCGAFGSYFMKKGAAKFKLSIDQIKNHNLIFGLGIYLFSTVFYIISLKMGDLSILYPLTSFSYIWTIIISAKLLNEIINLYKVAGILLIMSGVVFIAIN